MAAPLQAKDPAERRACNSIVDGVAGPLEKRHCLGEIVPLSRLELTAATSE